MSPNALLWEPPNISGLVTFYAMLQSSKVLWKEYSDSANAAVGWCIQ